MSRILIPIILLVCWRGEFAVAQQPGIAIRTNRDFIQIADPFEVQIEVVADSDASVQFPALLSTIGPFEIVDHRDVFAIPFSNNRRRWTRMLTLETLETGTLEIPMVEVFVRQQSTGDELKPPIRIATQPLAIEVATVLESGSDSAKFNDIRDVIDILEPVPVSYAWLGWSAIGGMAVAVAAACSFFVVGRKRWTTPSVWARREIEGLDVSSATIMDDLVRILRTFIEDEFGFPATSYTADQLVQEISRSSGQPEMAEQMRQFLTAADQSKFAGLRMGENEIAQAQATALQLVQKLDAIPMENS